MPRLPLAHYMHSGQFVLSVTLYRYSYASAKRPNDERTKESAITEKQKRSSMICILSATKTIEDGTYWLHSSLQWLFVFYISPDQIMQAQISAASDAGHIVICLQVSCQWCGWHTICIVASVGCAICLSLSEHRRTHGNKAKAGSELAAINHHTNFETPCSNFKAPTTATRTLDQLATEQGNDNVFNSRMTILQVFNATGKADLVTGKDIIDDRNLTWPDGGLRPIVFVGVAAGESTTTTGLNVGSHFFSLLGFLLAGLS